MIDLIHYQARLEEHLTRIIAELATIATYDEMTDNWEAVPVVGELQEADLNSEADAIETWNERRATLSDLEIEYRDIKRALLKITENTFGLCEIAGEPIEEKRLAFKPTSRTCLAHLNEESQLPL